MKYITILVFILASCSNNLQEEAINVFSEKDKINWTKFEEKISLNQKELFTQKLISLFPYFFEQTQFDSSKYGKNGFESHLHFLDINGDKLIDVIYEGFSGAESDNTQFFLNVNGEFKKVFEAFQYLENLEFENHKLKSFKVLDFGCCAEYIEHESKFNWNEGKPKIVWKRSKPNYVKNPESFFSKPIGFQVINNGYVLRSSPMIDDTSTIIYDNPDKGNLIAKYPSGTKGIAIASSIDKFGREWWFVEMEPVRNLKESLVYQEGEVVSKIMGWMSSRYLKKE